MAVFHLRNEILDRTALSYSKENYVRNSAYNIPGCSRKIHYEQAVSYFAACAKSAPSPFSDPSLTSVDSSNMISECLGVLTQLTYS
jgi:hypothetical protein